MRLNLLNTTALVAAGLYVINCERFNPRFGAVGRVSDNVFKYALPGPPKEVFLLERVSLAELFEGIPQSIVGIEKRDWWVGSEGEIGFCLNLKSTVEEMPFVDAPSVPVPDTDELGKYFLTWVEWIGLGGLKRNEVELSVMDDYLIVDAKNSPVFSGTVSVKIK